VLQVGETAQPYLKRLLMNGRNDCVNGEQVIDTRLKTGQVDEYLGFAPSTLLPAFNVSQVEALDSVIMQVSDVAKGCWES
jgi:hypothetical protein